MRTTAVDERREPEPQPQTQERESTETQTVVAAPTDVRSATLTILAVLAVVSMFQFAQAMLIPIVLGVLISYALDPIVTSMSKLRVPRPIGAALMLIVLTAGGAWLLYGLRTQAVAILDELPRAVRQVRERIESDRPRPASPIEQVKRAANEIERVASAATKAPPPPGVQRVQVEAPPFDIGDFLMSGS